MLFLVRMDVHLPDDMTAQTAEDIKGREKEYARRLQLGGQWAQLWRVVGEYSNYSVFDVTDNDELHAILSGLPLFPFMAITVTPLATHPSRIDVSATNDPIAVHAKEQRK